MRLGVWENSSVQRGIHRNNARGMISIKRAAIIRMDASSGEKKPSSASGRLQCPKPWVVTRLAWRQKKRERKKKKKKGISPYYALPRRTESAVRTDGATRYYYYYYVNICITYVPFSSLCRCGLAGVITNNCC